MISTVIFLRCLSCYLSTQVCSAIQLLHFNPDSNPKSQEIKPINALIYAFSTSRVQKICYSNSILPQKNAKLASNTSLLKKNSSNNCLLSRFKAKELS